MNNKEFKGGQVLLLVLLAMAALATVTLSVISRSVSDVSVTSREEESLRAFSAAEAGVEEALVSGGINTTITRDLEVASSGETSVVSTYTADIESYPENAQQYAYPFELLSGEAGSVWFVSRDDNTILPCSPSNPCFSGNSINLCWGKPDTAGDPAVYVNVIYERNTAPDGYESVSVGYDTNATRRNSNKFSSGGGGSTIAGQAYNHCANIDLTSFGSSNFNIRAVGTPIFMRVSMLYNVNNPHVFGVSTSGDLPTQGRKVTSEGQAGEVTRKIDAFLLNPEIPFIFDAALYSQSNIEK